MKLWQANFDELIAGSTGETIKEKSLVENSWLFVKFVKVFHHQILCYKYGMVYYVCWNNRS